MWSPNIGLTNGEEAWSAAVAAIKAMTVKMNTEEILARMIRIVSWCAKLRKILLVAQRLQVGIVINE